jgi:hypothetical protein
MFNIELINGTTISVPGTGADFGAVAAKVGDAAQPIAAIDDVYGETHYIVTQHIVHIYEVPETDPSE